jgi:preprotein translocase subunit SecG
MLEAFLCILWIIVSLFLVLIILLQRGKGGGLAGALGGVGGSSAFGTKAGDIFTRITVGVFAVWLLLAMSLVWKMKPPARFLGAAGPAAKEAKEKGKEEPKLPLGEPGKGIEVKTPEQKKIEDDAAEKAKKQKELDDAEKLKKEAEAAAKAKKDQEEASKKKQADPKSPPPNDGKSTTPGKTESKSPEKKP